ncbi:MAG: sialate O-acetylesterase [Planctomycetota bacterium]
MRQRLSTVVLAISICVSLVLSGAAHAVPTPAACFTSHMVLQRDAPVPVWGTSFRGERVRVSFAGQTVHATADAETGRWRVTLDPMPMSKVGRDMVITGESRPEPVTLTDVLVGDVWLCSGQSNMAWTLGLLPDASETIAAADEPLIRQLRLRQVAASLPRRDVPARGGWRVCTPETAGGFTAVGYHFARKIHAQMGIPIGLVNVSWNGTRIEPWTAPRGFAAAPELKDIAEQVRKSLPDSPEGQALYLRSIQDIRDWTARAEQAIRAGSDLPPMPSLPEVQGGPSTIYHGMVHPLVPMAFKGVIWYQGESNGSEGDSYFHKKQALIGGWRDLWGHDFPFYFVQLADFQTSPDDPAGGDGWAQLREAQRKSLTIPKTGMAVAIDIGEANDIHPRNKHDVGKRLALWALAKDYGQDIVFSGPLYRGHAVEAGTVRVAFDYVGDGLMVGHKEGTSPTQEVVAGELAHFAIAGEDRVWHWARAQIDGEAVLVSSPEVAAPVAVRYGFRMNPRGANLYNRAGLPASPFRTDDWPAE